MEFFYLKNGMKSDILYARRIEIGTIAPLTMIFNMKFNKSIKTPQKQNGGRIQDGHYSMLRRKFGYF